MAFILIKEDYNLRKLEIVDVQNDFDMSLYPDNYGKQDLEVWGKTYEEAKNYIDYLNINYPI